MYRHFKKCNKGTQYTLCSKNKNPIYMIHLMARDTIVAQRHYREAECTSAEEALISREFLRNMRENDKTTEKITLIDIVRWNYLGEPFCQARTLIERNRAQLNRFAYSKSEFSRCVSRQMSGLFFLRNSFGYRRSISAYAFSIYRFTRFTLRV